MGTMVKRFRSLMTYDIIIWVGKTTMYLPPDVSTISPERNSELSSDCLTFRGQIRPGLKNPPDLSYRQNPSNSH